MFIPRHCKFFHNQNLHNLKSNLIAVVSSLSSRPALNSGILTFLRLDLNIFPVLGSLKLALIKWVPGINNFQYSPYFVVLTGCLMSTTCIKAPNNVNMRLVKVAQINYVSRNQLHCAANLNFVLIYKKAKYCWALSTNFLFLFS